MSEEVGRGHILSAYVGSVWLPLSTVVFKTFWEISVKCPVLISVFFRVPRQFYHIAGFLMVLEERHTFTMGLVNYNIGGKWKLLSLSTAPRDSRKFFIGNLEQIVVYGQRFGDDRQGNLAL